MHFQRRSRRKLFKLEWLYTFVWFVRFCRLSAMVVQEANSFWCIHMYLNLSLRSAAPLYVCAPLNAFTVPTVSHTHVPHPRQNGKQVTLSFLSWTSHLFQKPAPKKRRSERHPRRTGLYHCGRVSPHRIHLHVFVRTGEKIILLQ